MSPWAVHLVLLAAQLCFASLPVFGKMALHDIPPPVFATAGAIALLDEQPTLRLVICGAVVLVGVWLATASARSANATTARGARNPATDCAESKLGATFKFPFTFAPPDD